MAGMLPGPGDGVLPGTAGKGGTGGLVMIGLCISVTVTGRKD